MYILKGACPCVHAGPFPTWPHWPASPLWCCCWSTTWWMWRGGGAVPPSTTLVSYSLMLQPQLSAHISDMVPKSTTYKNKIAAFIVRIYYLVGLMSCCLGEIWLWYIQYIYYCIWIYCLGIFLSLVCVYSQTLFSIQKVYCTFVYLSEKSNLLLWFILSHRNAVFICSLYLLINDNIQGKPRGKRILNHQSYFTPVVMLVSGIFVLVESRHYSHLVYHHCVCTPFQVWTPSWSTSATKCLKSTSPSAGAWPTANHTLST